MILGIHNVSTGRGKGGDALFILRHSDCDPLQRM